MAFNAILQAVMRGNAEVQGQTQAKKIASDQIDSQSKMTVTMKPNPTGGPPLVTVKDAPADLLNGTQASDVEQAYTTPKINVEKKLQEQGFRPKSPFVEAQQVDQFSERYRARRELGGGVIKSAIMAGLTGARTDERLRDNLANQRAAQNSMTFQKFVKPVMDEEQDEAQIAGTAAATRENATKRRADLIGKVATFVPGSTQEDVVGSLSQQLGGLLPGEEEQARKAWQTGRVSYLTERSKSLAGTEGQNAIEGYGEADFNRFVGEQVGVDPSELNERELNRFVGVFSGLQKRRRDAAMDAELKRKADERAERREVRMAEIAGEVEAGRRDAREAAAEQRRMNNANTLATQYDKQMADYRKVNDRLATIEALAQTASGANDVALLYQYMKELDSDSVVRESEFKTASNIGSVYTRFKQGVEQAFSGKRLTPENKQAIVNAARTLAKAWEPKANQIRSHYKGRAKRAGVDARDVGYDIEGDASGAEFDYVPGQGLKPRGK